MPNNRSVSTFAQKSLAAGGAAVYRQNPAPGATVVVTRPADGTVAATDVWQEVYQNGADAPPSYVLIAKAGQTVAPHASALISA